MKLSFPVLLMSTQWLDTVDGNRHFQDDHKIAPITGQWSFRVGASRNLAEGYGRIYSDASCVGVSCGKGPFCIELRNRDTSDKAKLTLGDCSGPGWRLDSDGFFHSEVDDTKCMQASQTGRPEEGQRIRMFSCDPDNALQQFVYEGGQRIKPIGDLDLCMVWQGDTPDVHDDNIILKQCDDVSERNAWSGDFPVEEGCSLSDPQKCALYRSYDESTCPSFFPTFVEFLCPEFYMIPPSGIDKALADEWCADEVPARDSTCLQRCSSYLRNCCPFVTAIYSPGFGDSTFAWVDESIVYNTNDIPGGVERGPNSSGEPGSFEFVYDDNVMEWLSYQFQVSHFNGFMNSPFAAGVESIESVRAAGIAHDGLSENISAQFGVTAVTSLSDEELGDAVNNFLASNK